ncbi:MAG: histidine phosphatase family protein [Nitrospirota bacterium]
MTKIILVRHGQTSWNLSEIFRGRIDIDLDSVGIEQAKLLGRSLSIMQINAVYSSPLKRALNTSIPIANYHQIEVNIDDRFIDINYGDWQGKSQEEVKETFKELYQKWLKDPHLLKIPDGETLEEVRIRAVIGLNQILSEHNEGTIVIVSHRVINKVLICALLGLDNSSFWQIKQDTACFSIFNYDERNFILTLHNESCHLKPIQTQHETVDF